LGCRLILSQAIYAVIFHQFYEVMVIDCETLMLNDFVSDAETLIGFEIVMEIDSYACEVSKMDCENVCDHENDCENGFGD